MLDRIDRGNGVALTTPMDPEYGAFRGAFGGWSAAFAFLAARTLAPEEFVPSSLSIDFIGAIVPGPVVAAPSLTATTRTTRFVQVITTQGDRPCANTSAIFSARRPTQPVAVAAMPSCTAAAALPRFASRSGPNTWIDRFDLRIAEGVPLAPSAGMRSLVWTSLDDTSPDPHATLAAMADASFPRIYFHFAEATPIATLTMSVHFHANGEEAAAGLQRHVLVEAGATTARQGFFDQFVRVWSEAGLLLMTSTQLVRYDVAAPA